MPTAGSRLLEFAQESGQYQMRRRPLRAASRLKNDAEAERPRHIKFFGQFSGIAYMPSLSKRFFRAS